jgi:hypothetical protein
MSVAAPSRHRAVTRGMGDEFNNLRHLARVDPRARSVVESFPVIKLNSQKHLRGFGG